MNKHVSELESEKVLKIDAISRTKNEIVIREIENQVDKLEQQIKECRKERAKIEITEDDISDFLKQARHLIEHPGEMLINQENIHQRQALASLYFEEQPTYTDISNGTPKLSFIFRLTELNQSPENQRAALRGVEPRFYA